MKAPRLKIRQAQVHCETCPVKGQATLCAVPYPLLCQLDVAKSVQCYPRGHSVFLQGNQPLGLYAMISGKVKITKAGRGGQRQIVRLAGPGELLGYRSLLSKQPYGASAETLEDSQICFVEKFFFRKMLSESTGLADAFFEKLSTELGAAEKKMLSFAQSTVRQRVAEILCDLQHRFGTPDGGLGVYLTREEIAELAGTTQESTIRIVAEFQKCKWIRQEQRQDMVILNSEALKKIAFWND